MPNERFSISIVDSVYSNTRPHYYDDGELLTDREVCDLLNSLSDEYHTLQELYDFRLVYNALLFNNWHKHNEYEVYKSKKHHDGEPCFDGEWFIVVAILPTGQISNHYHIDYWDYFKIPEYEKMKDEFDGHTSSDVLDRLKGVL